jgi:NADH-quinone oxidoreductase subunit L
MWFLDHAWLIPVIPAASFFVILLFGKRTNQATNGGSYIGIAAILTSFVLAVGTAYQWIQRVQDHEGGENALAALGHSIVPAQEHTKAFVEPVIHTWTWWQNGGIKFGIGTHIDGLAVALLVVVTIISSLVQIYSLEYVRGDRRFTHYFAGLSLFTAGMLTLVVAENTIQLLLGWEIMGLCSFMLIGHWWEDQKNSSAALKAFFTTRTGDIGLMVGIVVVFFGAGGTFSIDKINAWALSGDWSRSVIFWGALALFIGIIGKSGQFPLHTWLPDAMAGPTPVSALIHAATMVVAGVYLGARMYPVFYEGFKIADGPVNPMALIGGITIVIAAVLAFVQVDIKKVLAYSTVSQLGYMVMGLGVGAWTPAVFHIFTHAFFKALLFLGAGSVSHSGAHHSFDMKKDMGGLWRKMPITFVTFIIGTVALMGVPIGAGFFSKDEIIANAGNNGYTAFMVIGLIGAFLTAAYMARCVYLTFLGEYRGGDDGAHEHAPLPEQIPAMALAGAEPMAEEAGGTFVTAEDNPDDFVMAAADHAGHGPGAHEEHGGEPHESPALLTVPLIILAVLSLTAGLLNNATTIGTTEKFTDWVEASPIGGTFPALVHAPFHWSDALLSIGLALLGAVVGYLVCVAVYERAFLTGFTRKSKLAGAGYAFLWNKYYLDALYENVIVAGIKGPIARMSYWFNQAVLDGVVNGVGVGARKTGTWVYENIDQTVVDGIVNASGTAAEGSGQALRPIQSGKVQQYGALLFGAAAIGALILIITV